MKAFVTGSTGLLGNNLVRLLVEQGHEVKVLARSRQKAARLFKGLPVTVVEGDMGYLSGWVNELEGCEVLFHTAAYFREYFQPGDHWQTLETINVKGTIKLLEEAERRGVKKVIYVSSTGVIGMKPDGKPGDETTPPGTEAERNLYFKSKVVGEEAIARFLKEHRLPVVLILPGAMVGPGDTGPTSTGGLVLDFLARKLPGIPDGGFGMVDARDVARAMLNAVERGKSGERYIVGGEYASFENILKILEKLSGIPAPKWRIPHPVALIIAVISETVARLTRSKTLITLEAVRTIHAKQYTVSDKAKRELGVTFRSLEESLRDTVEWYRVNPLPEANKR
jgi:dihydroflavonol-4-reductase